MILIFLELIFVVCVEQRSNFLLTDQRIIFMSIQTVAAPDNHAPKFNLDKPSKSTQILTSKKFWLIAIGLCVLFLIIGGSFFSLISFLFLIAMLYLFSSIAKNYLNIFSIIKNPGKVPAYFQENHDYFKRHLIEKYNFHVDYETVGILIDVQAKRIALTLDPEVRPQAIICDFNDVQRWQAYSQGAEIQNQYGVSAGSVSNHFLSIYIRNPDQPRYDIFAANEAEADKWVARLNALLN